MQSHHNPHHSSDTAVEEQSNPQDMQESSQHEGHMEREEHQGHGSGGGHGGHVDHSGHEKKFRNRFWISLVLSVPVLVFSETLQGWFNYTLPEFTASNWITPAFAIIVFAIGGVPFVQMAVPEFRNRQPGMMTLITLAIGVAFVYSLLAFSIDLGEGFFWELVTLIDVMLLGHWLEMRSVRQASGALNELAKLLPDTAERIREDDGTEEVPVSDLREGDVVLVRPGANVPADGTVREGESEVNESMITGESKTVYKAQGDKVIAGTNNGDGSLRVLVTATGEAMALAGIMRLVQEAQESKSRTQILADKAAAWLFYGAIAISALTAVVWAVAVGFDAETFKRVVTVLVIACPHALGLAIPLVVAITTAKAANNGILVRDRLMIEAARNVEVVVFDKTGTLTEGKQGVVDMRVFDGIGEDEALAITAAIEGDSEHIIARAIRDKAEEKEVSLPKVSNFEAIKGRGVRASVNGNTYHVGGPRLLEMQDIGLSDDAKRFADEAGNNGQTVVYLIQDGKVSAAFALADVIRPESKEAVRKLQEMGIEVAMLTGDSKAVAKSVAEELGISTYFAEVLPQNKDDKIAELQSQGKRVAMVGDGVNDAPALARADVSIAIGSGTDVAVASAGIILVRSNPLDIVKIVSLSGASYRKMVQNLFWASGYNVIALPLAAGVLAPVGILLSPAVGAVFMSLSTVIVAINAQLLRRVKLGAA